MCRPRDMHAYHCLGDKSHRRRWVETVADEDFRPWIYYRGRSGVLHKQPDPPPSSKPESNGSSRPCSQPPTKDRSDHGPPTGDFLGGPIPNGSGGGAIPSVPDDQARPAQPVHTTQPPSPVAPPPPVTPTGPQPTIPPEPSQPSAPAAPTFPTAPFLTPQYQQRTQPNMSNVVRTHAARAGPLAHSRASYAPAASQLVYPPYQSVSMHPPNVTSRVPTHTEYAIFS